MNRIAISENGEKTGRWFDSEKAECFKEDTFWNGSNRISKSTGSQWHHEAIYVTKSGVFILNKYSDFQGSRDTYEIIEKEEAAEWFVKNEYSDDEIPEIFKAEVNALEIL